jgi:SLIT-ROBO Rho GTPase activating protein
VCACVFVTETVPGEAVAKFDYAGRSEKELSFHKGDVLQVAQHMSKDWWKGSLNGRTGLIPAGYVDVRYARNCIAIARSKLLSN